MAFRKIVFPTDVFVKDGFGTHVIQSGFNPHYHSYFEITYVLSGESKHITTEGEEMLDKSSFYILRPQDKHTYADLGCKNVMHRDIICSMEKFKEVCDFLNPKLYDEILYKSGYIKLPLYTENFFIAEQLIKQYSAVPYTENELRDTYARLIVAHFLSVFIDFDLNKTSNDDDLYYKIISAIHNPVILQGGIPALLQAVNFSHGYVSTVVKQTTGQSLISLFTEARLHYACQLLNAPDVSISDVAQTVGYESQSYFIRIFREQLGTTPLQYQKQLADSRRKTLNDARKKSAKTDKFDSF